jgi:hypothetical protein
MFERPILIYSNHCAYSKKFLDILMSHTELFQSFIRINIDVDIKLKDRPKIFYEIQNILNFKITEVPTIIVDNYILAGEDAFNWLNDNTKPPVPEEKEVLAFNPNEMIGFSDGYAGYGVTDMHEKTAEQSFAFLDKQYEEIYTPPEDGSDIKSNDLAKKQKERESFSNISNHSSNNHPSNNYQSSKYPAKQGPQYPQFNNKEKLSQKQKDMDSKYQELLQEREKLNFSISRV